MSLDAFFFGWGSSTGQMLVLAWWGHLLPKKRGAKNDIYLLVLPFQISRPLLSVSCAAFSSRRVYGRSFPGAYNDVCSRASIIKIIYHIILEFVVTSSQAAVDSSLTRNDNHSSFQPRTTTMTTENSSTAISVKRARRPSPGKILKNIIYLYIYNSVM